jgi:hypothetical protein
MGAGAAKSLEIKLLALTTIKPNKQIKTVKSGKRC